MSYLVYKHTNLINNKVYIGITQQNTEKRWQKGRGYKRQPHFRDAIKKYGWDNFKHEILFDNLSKEQAIEKEIELIAKYKSNNRKYGYNISKGGETYKENFKRRIGKEVANAKSVRVIDAKTNEIIGIYESQNLCAIALGINRKGITKNCRGLSKTYKGYIFEYADFDFIKPIRNKTGKHNNHHKTKVKCIEDNLIFSSIKEAGEYYNIRPNNIACCLCKSSKSKTAGGKHWIYDT